MRSDKQSKVGRRRTGQVVFYSRPRGCWPGCVTRWRIEKVEKIDIPDFKPLLGVRIVNHGLSWDEMTFAGKLLFLRVTNRDS
jgi:hypothetical protein